MNCFMCNMFFDDWKQLLKHFKLLHGLNRNSTYRCTYGDCIQFFNNLSTFGQHFKRHQHRDIINKSNKRLFIDNLPDVPVLITEQSILSDSQFNDNPQLPIDTNEVRNESLIPFLSQELGVAFVLGLHNKNNFARKDVAYIQQQVTENVVKPIVDSFKRFVTSNFDLQFHQIVELNEMISELENPFRNCSSDYRLINWLCKNDLLSSVQQFTINNEVKEIYHNGNIYFEEKDTTGVLLPLHFQFRKIFEHNDYLLKIIQEMKNISNYNTKFCNFIQGKLWRMKIHQYSEKITIPYFLYIDDVEINNPLGSHSDAMTMIYYSFPFANCAKLDSIYLASIFKSKFYKEHGNDFSLRCLVSELKKIEEDGIEIKTSDGTKKVHFILGLVVGDNLGLNTILGLAPSFSANYFCRFCKELKLTTHTQSVENQSSLRTLHNYQTDIVTNNMTTTGIKENSILNNIPSFCVVTNYAVDIMHDLFEGVCHYDMCHIISYLINTANYFSLELLNTRKQMFNYGEFEIGNISPEISAQHLKHSHLKMTSREMMCFIHFFSLMVGDLVSENDEVWLFFLNLLEIIDILLSFDISKDMLDLLKTKIRQHHIDYVRLFNDTLKPKHYLMIHYNSVILHSGPPRNYWCFRYEAKHRQFKMYARATTSRKNIPLSLAKKFQLRFAHYLVQPQENIYKLEECHKIVSVHHSTITNCITNSEKNYDCYSECIYRGNKYKKGYILSTFMYTLKLFEIIEIAIISNHSMAYVVCKEISIDKYCEHYSSFSVILSQDNDSNNILCICIDSFAGPPVNIHKISKGLNMVRLKEHF